MISKITERCVTVLSLVICPLALGLVLVGCSSPQVPASYKDGKALPDIYPDYVGVTVPVNMAPLHFQLMPVNAQTEVVTRFHCGEEEIVCGGRQAMPSVSDWQLLR